MLNRRHLRIKVLEALYAYYQSYDLKPEQGEKNLLTSINSIYDAFLLQLGLLVELIQFASKRIEENKNKFLPTYDDLNPNMRFVENKIVAQIKENPDFKRKYEQLKFSWEPHEELIRRIYQQFKDSAEYIDYMNSATHSYEDDKQILHAFIQQNMVLNDTLHNVFEEKNLYWNSDFYIAAQLVLKYIQSFNEKEKNNGMLPELFSTSNRDENDDDKQYVLQLYRRTILNGKEYESLIEKRTQNWELERIALMDMILLKMAICELIHFPTIPVKVTMNEYIDLSKYFSTPRSKIFINGVLDKLVEELKSEGKIKKIGRGLKE